jgi:hypothetical protein
MLSYVCVTAVANGVVIRGRNVGEMAVAITVAKILMSVVSAITRMCIIYIIIM